MQVIDRRGKASLVSSFPEKTNPPFMRQATTDFDLSEPLKPDLPARLLQLPLPLRMQTVLCGSLREFHQESLGWSSVSSGKPDAGISSYSVHRGGREYKVRLVFLNNANNTTDVLFDFMKFHPVSCLGECIDKEIQ